MMWIVIMVPKVRIAVAAARAGDMEEDRPVDDYPRRGSDKGGHWWVLPLL